VPLGLWALRTACAQAVTWLQQGLPTLSMAVNLSPRQFLDPNLVMTDIKTLLLEEKKAPIK